MGQTLLFFLTSGICIGFGVALFDAFTVLTSTMGNFVSSSIIGDIFEVFSACLPFDAVSVFGRIILFINATLTFLIARKLFNVLTHIFGITKG